MSEFRTVIDVVRQHYGDGFVPLHAPCFQGNEKTKLIDCIDSTFVSSVGKYVDQFEQQVAEFSGAKYAVAVVNGTMGLMLALRLVGVQAGDLVLTQSLSFVATANAISMLGAQPVFLDVDDVSLGLSANDLQQFLQTQTKQVHGERIHLATGRRIAACMPMHTLGFACEIDKIAMLCQQYGIALVEDAAESLGSFSAGQHTGTFGDIGVFSFNGNKILTTGGGGMLVTNNETLAKQAKHLSTTAKVPHAWAFEHDEMAYNLRMPNLNAALGVAQMEQLPEFLQQKQQLAEYYQRQFQHATEFKFLGDSEYTQSNHWLNALLFHDCQQVECFLKISNQQQIQTRPLWTPMHQLAIYQDAIRTELSNTENLAQCIVNIPSGVRCHVE